MKLRNKKTGKILGLGSFIIQNPNQINCESITKYDSLAELNEEWEDYEEHYWFICTESDYFGIRNALNVDDDDFALFNKAIGNYFETKEEAKKAVEKLKAWKRLKDAGLKFNKWDGYVDTNDIVDSGDHFCCCGFVKAYGKIYNNQDNYEQYRKDLDLLFGGEE